MAPPECEAEAPLVWITGAGGLIGSYLVRAGLGRKGWCLLPLTRRELDITHAAGVRALARENKPQLVFHCAALSKSPACQADPSLARRVNIEATAILAEICGEGQLVFLSTDLVFDGVKGNYVESDAVGPRSIYAETKVAAEQVVLGNPNHTVVRTSLNGGQSPTGDRGFNEEMRNAWEAGRTLQLFTDEFRCPIAAAVTAQALWALAEQQLAGVYHIAGSERLSRWQIGLEMAKRYASLQPRLEPGSLREYKGAPRSPDTSLNCQKFATAVNFPLPGFSQWLASHPEEPF